jgi:hypothetical protein
MRKRRVIVDDDSDSEEYDDGHTVGSEDCEESEDSDSCIDAVVQDRARMVLEVIEEAARNLIHPFELTDQEGEGAIMYDACLRVVKVVGYLAPSTSSMRWSESTKNLLSACCDARIRKITPQEKTVVRASDRCIVCGQKETSCQFVVDLATARDPHAYSFNKFTTTPEAWPEAFNTFLHSQRGPSKTTDGLPMEFLGSFAIGNTCLKRFQQSFSAQNFILDQIRTSWDHICSINNDPGYERYPTCTESRVQAFCHQLDAIKTVAVDESQPIDLLRDVDLWRRVDDCLLKKANGDTLEAHRISGALARRSIQTFGVNSSVVKRKSPRLIQKEANRHTGQTHVRAYQRSPVERGPNLPERAPDRLPSYQRTASDLFTLAADLVRSGQNDRAASVSAGGMVITELLSKLRESRVL